jgi:predicted nucleic acid-binding protein
MSARRAFYLDSSAIVKLAQREPESAALRAFLRRRRPLVSSALARVEVLRALLPLGEPAVRWGHDALAGIVLIRINDRILATAAAIEPPEVRSLDAIHLATMEELGDDLARVVTYDARMAAAAAHLGLSTVSPA